MSKSEEIVYRVYEEGGRKLRDRLFKESNRLTKLGGIYKHMEIGNKFEIAYANIINNKKKKENGKSK